MKYIHLLIFTVIICLACVTIIQTRERHWKAEAQKWKAEAHSWKRDVGFYSDMARYYMNDASFLKEQLRDFQKAK